jgi:acetyltransferase-like isoleucine patch superfamily enzyme
LLEIGEGALFGHGVAITAHVVVPTDGGELLAIVRPVRVGAGAFVGAGVVLGPGAVVAAAEVVPAGSARAGVRLSAGQVGG